MPAAALYTSALFRKSLLAAIDTADKVFILSAKHGVLELGTQIEPYDVTLKTMPRKERESWGQNVAPQLQEILKPRDTAVMFCGEEYLVPLRASLSLLGVVVEMPLGSLPLGSRLQSLGRLNDEVGLRETGSQFQQLIRRLWVAQSGGRRIEETSGRMPWPSRGVYFVLEPDQGPTRGRMPRIVRIGTHAVSQGSRTSLWDRLSTHRGTTDGSGSHRSSIFRLHVGRAWTNYNPATDWPQSWAQGQSAPREIRDVEQHLERKVSSIVGAMRVLWLDVPDEPSPTSERAYIERNTIGLLSRLGLLSGKHTHGWLGNYSPDWRISTSGLWNLNHAFIRPDTQFIDRLAAAIGRTIGRDVPVPQRNKGRDAPDQQLNFFEGGNGDGTDARGAVDKRDSSSDRSSPSPT